jgi:hypothetical protein
MSNKQEQIFKAKISEQAERYDDMVKVFGEIIAVMF